MRDRRWTEEMERAAYDMLYLAACGLAGTVPDGERIKRMDAGQVYSLSRFHNLAAITYMALESAAGRADPGRSGAEPEKREAEPGTVIFRKWREEKDRAIRKNIFLDLEREKLTDFLEKQGIWYMPLKGALLKEWYPKPGMRQMADHDILYDAAYQQEVSRWFVSQGYSAEKVGRGVHDVYTKAPFFNFEMHRSLFDESFDAACAEYYQRVKERLVPEVGKKSAFRFSDEDFYVYFLVHTYKHYANSGTGVRSLLDCYVILDRRGSFLDGEYVRRELSRLGLEEFEKNMRGLAEKLFDSSSGFWAAEEPEAPKNLTDGERRMLHCMLCSGTYGTLENRVANRLRRMQPDEKPISGLTKRRYLLRRLFPDEEHYKVYAPFVYRHKWLKPGYLIFRVGRGFWRHGAKLVSELAMLVRK